MKIINKSYIIYTIGIILYSGYFCKAICDTEKNSYDSTQVPIELMLNSSLIKKLYPDLDNPRIMSIADLDNELEKIAVRQGQCSFALSGDFNNDGILDIAFTGKYNSKDNINNTFFSIISIKEKEIIKSYFIKFPGKKVLLRKEENFKPNIDAIIIIFRYGSEDCFVLYWNGSTYEIEGCSPVVE